MALLVTKKLYIDIDKGIAYQRWNDFSLVQTPVFYKGDTDRIELHFVRITGNGNFPMQDYDLTGTETDQLVAAIGTPGGTPVATSTNKQVISAPVATYSAPVLTIPPEAINGYFTLEFSDGLDVISTTAPISIDASTSDIKTAIETSINSNEDYNSANATVTQVGDGEYSITVTAVVTSSSAVITPTIDVDSNINGITGYTVDLAMTGSGVTTLLGSNTEVTSTIEVQYHESSSNYQTLLQIPCTVRAQVISA